MPKQIKCLVLLIPYLLSISAFADELARRAVWGASFKPLQPTGREVSSIIAGSPLAAADLQPGDILLAVNGNVISSGQIWNDISDALVADKPYRLTLKRQGKTHHVDVTFTAAVKEEYEGIDVEYGVVSSDYLVKQRTITTIPTSENPLPAIFVIGGLSCSSIEYTPGRQSNFIKTLQYLVQHANMVVSRIEKPGLGDSEGDCSQTDFNTELNGYEVALQALLKHPMVDNKKVMIYGSSMGAAIAPYFVNKYQLNGIISDGPWYRTWFEHMLEIERRLQRMNGQPESEVNRRINEVYIPLYYGMLIQEQSYQQLTDLNPLLKPFNYHAGEHMYGRPVSFYHQLQDFDIAGEWAKLDVPVRVRWGTNDWIMSEYDIDMIAEVLAENGNTNVVVEKYPNMDHWYTLHESALNSYQGKPGKWDEHIAQQVVDWAQGINHKSNRP
ncbi:MAG: PDZ domain-containing protein [Aestuariibacter sp.]